MLDNGPRTHPAARWDLTPFQRIGVAMHTVGTRQVGVATASGTGEHGESTLRRRRKEASRRGIANDRSQAGAHAATRISADVDGGGAEVTKDTEAPGTWLLEVPRIWRTPSTMWFIPWM